MVQTFETLLYLTTPCVRSSLWFYSSLHNRLCALSDDTTCAKSAQHQWAWRAAACIKPSQLYACIAVPKEVTAPIGWCSVERHRKSDQCHSGFPCVINSICFNCPCCADWDVNSHVHSDALPQNVPFIQRVFFVGKLWQMVGNMWL